MCEYDVGKSQSHSCVCLRSGLSGGGVRGDRGGGGDDGRGGCDRDMDK